MRSIRLLGIALSAALVASGAACDVSVGDGGFSFDVAHATAKDTWTRSFALAQGGRLELINVNGRIEAMPADGDKVELSGERTAKASTEEAAKELLGNIEMREEAGPSKVRVEVRPPRTFGFSGGSEIRWTVKVPRGVVVDLRTVNGRVTLDHLSGEIRVRTVNGGVEGRALDSASIDASTVNGGVTLELATPLPEHGEVSLEAVNGGVSLALPAESRASIQARVTNGGIKADGLDLQITGEQTRRRLDGTLNGGGAKVSLETTNGGVKLSKVLVASKPTS
jgi:Putative adhesin